MKPMQPHTDLLLPLAGRSIEHGLANATVGRIDLTAVPAELRAPRATFITLSTPAEGLRGCRGVVTPSRPLALDVWQNAYASAFDDPRFPPVAAEEFADLLVEISLLSELEPLLVADEQELLRVLVPDRDGVVLTWRNRRATFLPKVWAHLPDAGEFVVQLKMKAGLPWDFWSPEIEVEVYTAELLSGRAAATPRDRATQT
jgi:hypothetical protein